MSRTCPQCGAEFAPTTNGHTYCSYECWKEARNARAKAMYFEARAEGIPPRSGAMRAFDVTAAWAKDAEPIAMDEAAERAVNALNADQRMGLMVALDFPLESLEAAFLGTEER